VSLPRSDMSIPMGMSGPEPGHAVREPGSANLRATRPGIVRPGSHAGSWGRARRTYGRACSGHSSSGHSGDRYDPDSAVFACRRGLRSCKYRNCVSRARAHVVLCLRA